MKLPIPLDPLRTVTIDAPLPLSVDEYDHLLEVLTLWRSGLTNTHQEAPPRLEPNPEITLEMRHALLALGYTPAEIVFMTTPDAERRIAERLAAERVSVLTGVTA